MSGATATVAADDDDDKVRLGTETIVASHPPMVPDDLAWADDEFVGVLAGSTPRSDGNYEWTYFGVYEGEIVDPEDVARCLTAIGEAVGGGTPWDELGDAVGGACSP